MNTRKHIVTKDFISTTKEIYFKGDIIKDLSLCSFSFDEIKTYLEPLN